MTAANAYAVNGREHPAYGWRPFIRPMVRTADSTR